MTKIKLQWHIEQRKVSDLISWDKNPRKMSDKERSDLHQSFQKFDYVEVVVIDLDNRIVGGHQRKTEMINDGKQDEIIDVRVPNRKLTEKEFEELAVRLNKNHGQWDEDMLKDLFDMKELEEWGFDMDELNNIFDIENYDDGSGFDPQSLQDKFLIPPFSIFDSRQGYWQDRKRQWNSLFNSQESREDVELIAKSGQSPAIYELRNKMRSSLGREPEWDEIIDEARKRKMHIYEGASIFDPVLTEICYRWFCPDGGIILDPFAGGSVRGIVAGLFGYEYHGIDLRFEQVNANMKQAAKLEVPGITWYTGDSSKMEDIIDDELQFDFVFSCPPYHDLEQYSDDPADLSNMNYTEFLNTYRQIITKAMMKLKQDRFACFVVGDIRDDKGFYKNFVSDTIDCFSKCIDDNGDFVRLYNEIILINVAGSLPIRVGRQFESGRKVGKMHQNVLVFYKGDPKKIKENFPEIKVEKYLQELNYQPNIAASVID